MGGRGAAAVCVRRGCEKASVMDLTETRSKIEDRKEMTDWVGEQQVGGVLRGPLPVPVIPHPSPTAPSHGRSGDHRHPPSHAAAGEGALKWRGVHVKF